MAYLGGFLEEGPRSQGRSWIGEQWRFKSKVAGHTASRAHTQMLAEARETEGMSEASREGLGELTCLCPI